MKTIDRRHFLTSATSLGLVGSAAAQGYGQAFAVKNDEDRPIANMRLPGEIVGTSGIGIVDQTTEDFGN